MCGVHSHEIWHLVGLLQRVTLAPRIAPILPFNRCSQTSDRPGPAATFAAAVPPALEPAVLGMLYAGNPY